MSTSRVLEADIVLLRTPDGHGRVELTRYHTPPAIRAEPPNAPANTLGIRRIMFTKDHGHHAQWLKERVNTLVSSAT